MSTQYFYGREVDLGILTGKFKSNHVILSILQIFFGMLIFGLLFTGFGLGMFVHFLLESRIEILISLPFIFIGCLEMFQHYRMIKLHLSEGIWNIFTYTDGFILARKGQIHIVYWSDVTLFAQETLMSYGEEAGIPYNTYRVETHLGDKFTFTGFGLGRLRDIIIAYTSPDQSTAAYTTSTRTPEFVFSHTQSSAASTHQLQVPLSLTDEWGLGSMTAEYTCDPLAARIVRLAAGFGLGLGVGVFGPIMVDDGVYRTDLDAVLGLVLLGMGLLIMYPSFRLAHEIILEGNWQVKVHEHGIAVIRNGNQHRILWNEISLINTVTYWPLPSDYFFTCMVTTTAEEKLGFTGSNVSLLEALLHKKRRRAIRG